MKNNRILKVVLIIIENLLLGLAKFWIIAMFGLAAFLDDYIVPLTTLQKATTFGTGILIAIGLDLLANFIMYKILNRKEKIISYKTLVICSLAITILEVILMSV